MPDWQTIAGFVRIGTLGKTHGADGELKIHIDEPYTDIASQQSFLFVNVSGNYVPYEIDAWRDVRGLVVQFARIDNATKATALAGCEIALPEQIVGNVRQPQSTLEYDYLAGYVINEVSVGRIGEITRVMSYPQQEMAVVIYRGSEVLIPLNPTFIQGIDKEQQVVTVDLPEGLLDQ